jgi:Short C-terminal domain
MRRPLSLETHEFAGTGEIRSRATRALPGSAGQEDPTPADRRLSHSNAGFRAPSGAGMFTASRWLIFAAPQPRASPMMHELTPEGQQIVTDAAQRHRVSADAVLTLLRALVVGHGTMAQFNHPELGGMGQWTQGGMIMVGNMFDHGLKARVDALCTELAALLRDQPSIRTAAGSQTSHRSSTPGVTLFDTGADSPAGTWWPPELGQPSSAGSQNDLRYAIFPAARRLAIEKSGQIAHYDTGDHLISGVSQQQGADQSLTFVSQHGLVRLRDLPVVEPGRRSSLPDTPQKGTAPGAEPVASMMAGAAPPKASQVHSEDIFSTLERLAELHKKGVLTDDEFAGKKAELLARI